MSCKENELLFPTRVIPALRDLRGYEWKSLVDSVTGDGDEAELDQIAFVLMMVRFLNCHSCQANSYRALNGCTLCASTALNRFQGSDLDILSMFEEAREDVRLFFEYKNHCAFERMKKSDKGGNNHVSEKSNFSIGDGCTQSSAGTRAA
jgi:hypothetical protein